MPEEDAKPGCGFACVRATSPVSIGVCHEIMRGGLIELQAEV